jgi:outer membrane protein assembly factor BamB
LELYGDLVFVTTTEGRFYALNSTNGLVEYSIAPSYEIEGLYNYITTPISPSIVALNGKVVFSASGNIYCLDAQTIEIESLGSNSSRNGLLLTASIIFIVAFFSILAYFLFVIHKNGGK